MISRVGQPPTNSAAHIATAPKPNWRKLPPRLIERELAVPPARRQRAEHDADDGEERPGDACLGDEELRALDVVEDPVGEVAPVAGRAEAVGGGRRDAEPLARRRGDHAPRRSRRRRASGASRPTRARRARSRRVSRRSASRCRPSFGRAGGRAGAGPPAAAEPVASSRRPPPSRMHAATTLRKRCCRTRRRLTSGTSRVLDRGAPHRS